MNKALLTLNIVLIIALGYLYYAFYNTKNVAEPAKVTQQTDSKTNFKIVYFDLDTLEKNYVFAKETRDYLKDKNDAMEGKLNKIRQDYTAKVNDYNKRGATLSQTEQSQMQEDLARLDNYYSQQQQSLNQDFQGEYMRKMLDLKNKIQSFLSTYSAQKGYEYIFASSGDDNIYYKDSLRNITTDVVVKLNEEYNKKKKK